MDCTLDAVHAVHLVRCLHGMEAFPYLLMFSMLSLDGKMDGKMDLCWSLHSGKDTRPYYMEAGFMVVFGWYGIWGFTGSFS